MRRNQDGRFGREGVSGWVYVLHFNRPYRHACHYVGWSEDLFRRLDAHAEGHGGRLMAVIKAAGIGFRITAVFPGTRELERRIKRQHGGNKVCPLCKARAR